jgi:hypothetical protein
LWKQPSDASVAWQHRAIRWGGRVRVLLTADPYLAVPPKLYGGIERIVGLLIVELKKRGHIVGLVAHPESTAPVDYLRGWSGMVPQSTSDHVANVRTLLKATREFQPSIVHSFSRLAYLAPLLLRRLPKLMSYQRHTGGNQIRLAAALAGSVATVYRLQRVHCQYGAPGRRHVACDPEFCRHRHLRVRANRGRGRASGISQPRRAHQRPAYRHRRRQKDRTEAVDRRQ